MTIKIGVAAAVIGLLAVAPAMAQTGGSAAPEKTIPDASATTGRSESLSTKLNKSDGVIKPNEDVDPGIRVPAPDPHPGSTPVIPPSATGGNSAK